MQARPFPILAILLCAGGAAAQTGGPYALAWSTIDGGGGASGGGAFSLHGSIGQPDAGPPLAGGSFSLDGGFWPGVEISSPAPVLAIRVSAGQTVVLSWPAPSSGYALEQTGDMNAPGGGWTAVAQSPTIVGTNLEVSLPATGRFCMFRLRRNPP